MSTDTANGRRSGVAGAAFEVLLTDAAVGNPASRVVKEPAGIARAAVKRRTRIASSAAAGHSAVN